MASRTYRFKAHRVAELALRVEELDELFIIPALETGNRTWIADYIRKGGELNTPRLRKLFLDLVEKKKGSWPRHRVRSDKTSIRHGRIAAFVFQRLDEGMLPEDAQHAACKEFKVSQSTVRNACKNNRIFHHWHVRAGADKEVGYFFVTRKSGT